MWEKKSEIWPSAPDNKTAIYHRTVFFLLPLYLFLFFPLPLLFSFSFLFLSPASVPTPTRSQSDYKISEILLFVLSAFWYFCEFQLTLVFLSRLSFIPQERNASPKGKIFFLNVFSFFSENEELESSENFLVVFFKQKKKKEKGWRFHFRILPETFACKN